ncbi:DUF6503 family protein [Dokdonia ponticola]|uniref:DUF6503 family protein n=1 Tax=Dokdonia ponticola TaxID=2041041 RepID=A0ABV9HZK9_9FLAO
MKTLYTLSILFLVTVSCTQKTNTKDKTVLNEITPDELLQKTINAHGGESFKNSLIEFNIDKTFFSLQYDNGRANFKQIRQVNNDKHLLSYKYGLIEYFINDSLQSEEKYSKRMAEISLFGFLYTFSIPFNLTTNDVILSRQPNVIIRQKEYFTLDVQFTKIPDLPEDHFLLYIDVNTYEIGYTAIQHDLSGSKQQFRRMTEPKRIKDILFQDYILFHANDTITPLEKLYTKYNQSDLKVIRTIQFDSISVQPKS